MATYDYTVGSQGENAKSMGYASAHSAFVLKRKFDVETVIAWDSTLTANAKITSGDVFKVLAVPDDTFVHATGFKIITAFAACTDIDIGPDGGDQFQDGADPTGTAGSHLITLVGDDYGANNVMGYVFTTGNTIDITFNADETSGTILIYAIAFDVADDEGTD